MHPLSYEYHEMQFERLRAAFAPFARPSTIVAPQLYVAAGEPVFAGYKGGPRAYLVTSGEVLIVRHGQPVDLLEAGDLLDLQIWPGATAMALADSTFAVMDAYHMVD
jgi:hypothetical protein